MRNSLRIFAAALGASVFTLGTMGSTTAHAQTCVLTPGECCAARPSYSDPLYTYGGDVLVGTREVEAVTNACVTIFDITQPYPGNGVDYTTVGRYHGPGDSWNVTNLGSVFGLTVDQYGNIFVCATSCYGLDYPGPGGDGAVYRISNGSGAINTFINLPNSFGVGLGNISYDCDHDQFFVTNHEDGKIYRIKTSVTNGATATVQESFDPLIPDDGLTGFAPLGERLWGVQWHAGRVYYSVWSQNCNETSGPANSIRSVALTGAGAFIPGSDQLEITMPSHVNNYSHPVSDISFTRKGTMLLAERSMSGPSSPAAHESRLLEYGCDAVGGGGWAPSGNTFVLGVNATCCCSGIAGNGSNCAGGTDSDFAPYNPATPFGRVWGTSDAINNFLTVYGIQGLPPNGGIPAASAWIDFDGGLYAEKTNLGDVEVPCPDLPTSTLLSLFTADPVGSTMQVRWQFADPGDIASVELERAEHSDGPYETVASERRFEGDATVIVDRGVEAGHTYFYRLNVRTAEGEELLFGPVASMLIAPIAKFSLSLLTANPSEGPIRLEFTVPRQAAVRVTVVNVTGRHVQELANGTYVPGRYSVTWDTSRDGLSAKSGVYFVRFQTPDGNFSKRIVVRP